jgi:hypothetical protein
MKQERGFTIPEHVKAGVAIPAVDWDEEQEQEPIIKANRRMANLFRVAFCSKQHGLTMTPGLKTSSKSLSKPPGREKSDTEERRRVFYRVSSDLFGLPSLSRQLPYQGPSGI